MTRPAEFHLSPDDIDALLARDARASAHDHLEACAECAARYAAERDVVERLSTLPLARRLPLADRVMLAWRCRTRSPCSRRLQQAAPLRVGRALAAARRVPVPARPWRRASLSLGNRIHGCAGTWLGKSGGWLVGLRGAASNLMEQPCTTVRGSARAPARIAAFRRWRRRLSRRRVVWASEALAHGGRPAHAYVMLTHARPAASWCRRRAAGAPGAPEGGSNAAAQQRATSGFIQQIRGEGGDTLPPHGACGRPSVPSAGAEGPMSTCGPPPPHHEEQLARFAAMAHATSGHVPGGSARLGLQHRLGTELQATWNLKATPRSRRLRGTCSPTTETRGARARFLGDVLAVNEHPAKEGKSGRIA